MVIDPSGSEARRSIALVQALHICSTSKRFIASDKDIGSGQAALRKMFVAAPFRGREFSVAARLLNRLVEESAGKGVTEVFLGTTDKFLAAHRFYEKHGFREITKVDLPASFPLISVDSKFYALSLGGALTG